VSRAEIAVIAARLRSDGKKIVSTNGAFDIIHAGHVEFLQHARSLGDVLIVGLNSDSSVRSLKGDKRPINSEADRAFVLAGLECVDFVVIFDEREPSSLLEQIKPSIHVKASEYSLSSEVHPSQRIWEKDVVEKNGGVVRLLPIVSGKSTTNIIAKVVDCYRDEQQFKKCREGM
jgi:rfaE bifunctional protein nucleotidyltransferase chain/domain